MYKVGINYFRKYWLNLVRTYLEDVGSAAGWRERLRREMQTD